MSENVVSSLTVGLLLFGVGYVFLKLVPQMWKRAREKSTLSFMNDDYHEYNCSQYDEDEAVIKIDAKKKLCQQIKFAMRLKRQMKRFKQRKNAESHID